MVLVYLNSGECIEIQDAVRAERAGDKLICYDPAGSATATFDALEVETFTANEDVADQIKEEVCEDLTVVEEGEVVRTESSS